MKRTPPEMIPPPSFPDIVLGNQLEVAAHATLAADHENAATIIARVGHTDADGQRVVEAAEGSDTIADPGAVAIGVEDMQDADGRL